MDTFDVFASVSPLEYRYLTNVEAARVREFLSEEAFIKYLGRVESALVQAYAKVGVCSAAVAKAVQEATTHLSAAEVYQEEERTHHQMRAFANCLAAKAGPTAAPWIHLGATSEDIISTANALRYRDFCDRVLLPALIQLEKTLLRIARRDKDQVQIGRTHGQHAVPITFGFTMAEYVSRVGTRIEKIYEAAHDLRGKFAGAVGAYNAQSLFLPDPFAFELSFLESLSLKPADHSTQIVEPEYQLDFLHDIVSTLGVFANLADDMRHLQRSEIGEVREATTTSQVGSSTMPHKQNPISFEHIKALWKVFMPRLITSYLDQISEHQRDLSNSASSRFVGEVLTGLHVATLRLDKAMSKLEVHPEALRENLQKNWSEVIAEPCYILLARNGHTQAHETVRKWVRSGGNLVELLQQELHRELTAQEKLILSGPQHYTGLASEKTRRVCDTWDVRIDKISKKLPEILR